MVPFAHDGREEQTHTVPSARGNGKRARITLSAGSAGFQPASSFPCWERQPPAGLGEGNAGWKPALPAPVGSIFCPLWETGGRHTHWPLQSEKSNPWGRLRRPGGTDQRPAVPGALRQEMSAGRRPDPRRRREPGPLPLQGSPHGPDDHLHACPRRVPAPPPPACSPLGLPPGPLLRLPGPGARRTLRSLQVALRRGMSALAPAIARLREPSERRPPLVCERCGSTHLQHTDFRGPRRVRAPPISGAA